MLHLWIDFINMFSTRFKHIANYSFTKYTKQSTYSVMLKQYV